MDWGNVFSSFSHFHPFARDTMGLKQISVEDINTVLGIFLVNDFEINSSVGIMNINMLYVWLLQWQYVCTWKDIALINRWRNTLTCTMIMTMTSAYRQRCKDCIDSQVEDDVDMRPNSVSGLFPLGCILSHDCRANTVHTFESFEVSQSTFISSVRSSNSHPDLLLTQQHHHPTFSDHTGPQHWTFTFWATTAI